MYNVEGGLAVLFYDISMSNINLWSYVTWECENAYGSGGCLRNPSTGTTSYAASFVTIKTAP